MVDTRLDSSGEPPSIPFNEDALARLCGDGKTARRFFDPVKSEYQKRLEKEGWEHVGNEIATNYHIGLDLPTEPLKKSLERMKKDYETKICPGKIIGFFRAYNTSGERIPYPYKERVWEGFERDAAVVAVYVKDI